MRPITVACFPKAQAALVVFDVTQRSSFLDVEAWLGRLHASGPGDVKIVLVGNKCDMEAERVRRPRAHSLTRALTECIHALTHTH
jgi:GTPase SAR1 family protein